MRDYRTETEALRERIARRREALRVLEQLKEQESACRQTLSDLQLKYVKEQEDVDKLSHLSWSSIWAVVWSTLASSIRIATFPFSAMP